MATYRGDVDVEEGNTLLQDMPAPGDKLMGKHGASGGSNEVMSAYPVIGVLAVSFLLLSGFVEPAYRTVLGCTFFVSLGGLGFASYLTKWIMSLDEGSAQMISIAEAIRDGAEGFLHTQYSAIAKMACVVAALIFTLYATREPPAALGIGRMTLAVGTTFSFCVGALLSALAGYVGMWCAVRANSRVGAAAQRSYNLCLQVCLRAGAVPAVLVVSLVLLGICMLYCIFQATMGQTLGADGQVLAAGLPAHKIPLLLVGYGFGASFVALFAQLGGGIYTKAADVGADLVGKVEAGIPEDDPRNPAVIADLVGDNVGDCAGRGADLFESIAAEIVSAMILGGVLTQSTKMTSGGADATGYVLFPLAVHAMDIVVSSIGVMMVQTSAGANEKPMTVLKRGWFISVSLSIVGFFFISYTLLSLDQAPDAWWHFALCGMVGIAACFAFIQITQHFTDDDFAPVRSIAKASATGDGTNVIAGLAVGMESTGMPVLAIVAAILSSYKLGTNSGLVDAAGLPAGGLFGTAVATMGMLSTAVYVLAMDVFGPIADNAGGIVEMDPAQPERVRAITDRLDAVGNTTKAITKGYAVGSAALACFLLFSAFMDEVHQYSGKVFKVVDISVPEVFCGGMLGAMLVFYFSGLCMKAVGVTAEMVVVEVRHQFAQKPGIMTGIERPDYKACVEIVTQSALSEMRKPGLLAVCAPVAVGTFMRVISGHADPLIGAKASAAFLMFATSTGVLMALFLNNAGGAWDNAKKYIEAGAHGGKGSLAHKASITGDTVGDPCKDTAGPSIHVLIKMLSTVTLVMAPLFIKEAAR